MFNGIPVGLPSRSLPNTVFEDLATDGVFVDVWIERGDDNNHDCWIEAKKGEFWHLQLSFDGWILDKYVESVSYQPASIYRPVNAYDPYKEEK